MAMAESTWCLLQVRVVVPYQGPSSDSVVVRMIPDSRLPPRHLHMVRTGKTFAVMKWESPYDAPDQDLVSARPGALAVPSVGGAGVRARTLSWAGRVGRLSVSPRMGVVMGPLLTVTAPHCQL